MGRADRDHVFYKHTTSTCPECLALVETRVVLRGGKVYFLKWCPEHGQSEALVSEDAAHYVGAYQYARAGTIPLGFSTEVKEGCPRDCGLCPDHEQHTCVPIVEVTDHCNLACPICIVDNRASVHLSLEEFERVLDNLVEKEGKLDSVVLSGGEPTVHPRFFELVEAVRRRRPAIGRAVVVTNGVRLGSDEGFAEAFKASGAYASLQVDGFDDEVHRAIRGRPLQAIKEAALERLARLAVPTQLTFVPVRGINEGQIGRAVDLLLSQPTFLSLIFQPLVHGGRGGGTFPVDPMDRVTMPSVIAAIEEQTGGRVRRTDFIPLPCSHPQCVSLTYLLRLDDGSHVPFPRFVDLRRHLELLRASATLEGTAAFQDTIRDVIADLWSATGEVPDAERIVGALKRAVKEMYPPRPLAREEAIRASERQAKSIFLHGYMDRFDFDVERLRKCCHHYPQPDGRIMPACGFNLFHRGAARGPDTPRAPWGRPPFAGAR